MIESRGRAYRWGGTILVGACLVATLVQAADKRLPQRPPWTKSHIQGAPEVPAPYRIAPAFARLRFQKPTCIEEIPGANRLLVTEMGGKVLSFEKRPEVERADLVVDLRELLPQELVERGVSLFDAEFHPQFRQNHFLFVCYVHPGKGGHTRVSRFTLTAESPPRAVPASERVIIVWPSGGHNGGCLEFGTDGFLYISTGDGSGPNPPDGLTTGQDVSDLLGSILRIDIDRAVGDQAYAVPSDNPFVSQKDARPEIWAYGLRNPWKFGIDPKTGEVLAADNGWESWEMVHRIVRGGNCGWPVMEGRAALRSEVKLGPTPILPPVMDHPHTEANSVIGGPVYRGCKLPGLVGSFVYGDYITGTIWAIRPDKDGAYTHSTLVDTDQQIVAFTQSESGELFVLDYDFSGQIYELLPSDAQDTSATFPRRLSETGLFESLKTMQPAPGVVPYQVQVSRWMDGAQAERWVAVPGDGQIQLSSGPTAAATYPEGTVFVKQLNLPQADSPRAIRLETQILHFEQGTWRPYSYVWDDDGEDAELVAAIGASRPLKFDSGTTRPVAPDRTWHVNASNECKLCHNASARFVLGFTLTQLDRSRSPPPNHSLRQLAALAELGVLGQQAPVLPSDPSLLVDSADESKSLDSRARSYLHVNCGMCHHPGGNAIVSFYLRRELPFEKLNTNKGTGVGTFGMRQAKIIAPGDPYRSVLLYRMSKLGYARMPYIGSRVVDGTGVALIERWIRSLPSAGADGSSGPATAGSGDAKALQQLVSGGAGDRAARDAAIRALVSTTEGSLSLIAALHGGKLPSDDSKIAVAAGAAAGTSDVRGIFETFVPESQRRPTLGPKIDPQIILGRAGNRERGQLIFFSDGARCRACHEIDDRAQSLGPTLKEMNKKYPRPTEMLQHVLQPSLKIDEPFATYVLITDDGRALNGLLERQTDQEVVIRTAEKRSVRVARTKIEELRKSAKSLMPDSVLSDLTAQEAADLFEYIRSLGAAP